MTYNKNTMSWTRTSSGFGTGSIRYAHKESISKISPGKPFTRKDREALEELTLSPEATHSVGGGNRLIYEEADEERTCFERDRDRILHKSTAFRKLSGKTQALVFPKDGIHTRLTHTLEVMQIARSISQACRLNVPLTEAIALGHDCGHGPGGHASEEAVREFYPDFDHASFGGDVVLAPLNLTLEVIDGVKNHSWSRPAPKTLEGEVVSWADRIAYVCHDFEDAVDAGIVMAEDLPSDVSLVCGRAKGEQVGSFISDIINSVYTHGVLGMSDKFMRALEVWREFNYYNIYTSKENSTSYKDLIDIMVRLIEYHAEFSFSLHEDPLMQAVKYVVDSTDKDIVQQGKSLLNISISQLFR